MFLRINPSSGVPIYLQIESQIKQVIASGAMGAGDSIPSTRKLAAELRVNPNTVARAYQNLERDGVIRTVPGGGTYIADNVPGLLKAEKLRRLKPIATQLAVEASQMRLDPADLRKLLDTVLKELREDDQ
jgi:GntR family transcriptional regulator